MTIDRDTLVYLRQNIENEIKQNLESRLFKLYTIIGAAFLGGVGIIGFPWAVSYIDDKIQNAVEQRVAETKAVTDQARQIAESARRDVDKALTEIDVKRAALAADLEDIQAKSSGAAERLGTLRGEMQARSEEMAAQLDQVKQRLDEARDQAQALSDRLRTAIPDAGVVASLAHDLNVVVEQVKQLDLTVKTIAQQSGSQPMTVDEESRAVQLSTLQQSTGENAAKVQEAASTQTVYLQFARLSRDSAKAVSAQLQARGWRIPGEERIDSAAGLSEIRCYYEEDCERAKALETDTEAALAQLGYGDIAVTIRPLLSYSPKPRLGILEIWLGLGKASAS
ncbi:hypothetical protein [Inquilinus sp. Marseille-Q2685]|uniref:hypothetical protein n=1 Tax=Inquilinus sp. Marseille-Q2685 TaxID=2866581 RepID=UPI001CE42820|nr:hypothetical protein [Inquilinus sp. Marseille-Q2685]